MTTKRPLSAKYTGRPGRPAAVANVARNIIRETIATQLFEQGMFPKAMTATAIDSACKWTALEVIDALTKHDLRIIPASICRELALLVGEPAEAAKALAPMVGAVAVAAK